jgi:hypothetical protein
MATPPHTASTGRNPTTPSDATNELRNRGVQDIPIAVVDGLKGFPEAINAAFPETTVRPPNVYVRPSISSATR